MSTLVEFLTARLDEDEAAARDAHYEGQHWYSEEEFVGRWPECCDCGCPVMFGANRKSEAYHISRHDPARVLREVEAKRRIVALAAEIGDEPPAGWVWENDLLRALAAVYADHPDYRQEWA